MSAPMHAEEIKAALRMKGFTLAALADAAGVSRSMVSHVVQGHARSAHIESRISVILGKPGNEIFNFGPMLRRMKASAVDESTPAAQPADSAAAQLHTHTLNRIVPAMADGFTVQTRYGELAIEPGPLAERIRDLVALHAELGLIAATVQEVR